MKKIIENTIPLVIVLFLISSCSIDTQHEQEIETTTEHQKPTSKKFTEKQLELLEKHNEICTDLNRFRFFLHLLQEQLTESDFEMFVDKNWSKEQNILVNNTIETIDLSQYLINYENKSSVKSQGDSIKRMEYKMNEHFSKLDKTIDWNDFMERTKLPRLRK